MIDSKLMEILVCPLCKAPVTWEKAKSELFCSKCKLAYPIDDGIPVMLVDRARKIDDAK